jgi:hypothetical protein
MRLVQIDGAWYALKENPVTHEPSLYCLLDGSPVKKARIVTKVEDE